MMDLQRFYDAIKFINTISDLHNLETQPKVYTQIDFENFILEPFRRELTTNLQKISTQEEASESIQRYVSQFSEQLDVVHMKYQLQEFSAFVKWNSEKVCEDGAISPLYKRDKQGQEILREDPSQEFLAIGKTAVKVGQALNLIHQIMVELQLSCSKLGVEFSKISEHLQFELDALNDGLSMTGIPILENESGRSEPNDHTTPGINTHFRPRFNQETVPQILHELTGYFNTDHLDQLEILLKTGTLPSKPLIFLDNGNRLAFSFKLLFEGQFITGCRKKELKQWVHENFMYTSGNVIKKFTSDYLDKCISREGYYCKHPIFNIIDGKIIHYNEPRRKRMNSH
jgi:hypothetical protein